MTTEDHAVDSAVDIAIDKAIKEFSRVGYSDTRLETIARASGMSKRMLHYHFTDKQGLYVRALGEASRRLTPQLQDVENPSGIPVEGLRVLVEQIFDNYVANPDSVRLLTQESVIKRLEVNSKGKVADLSYIGLHLEKLLMVGHDAGAFRPGVSTNDIFTLIASLSMFRITTKDMLHNLLSIDMSTDLNTEGMKRLAVDTVIALLTSNLPDNGQESYLVTDAVEQEDEALPDIYESGDFESGTDIYG